MEKRPLKIVLLTLFLAVFPTMTQELPAPLPQPITAENVAQLQSVQRIDFAAFDAEFDTGMFYLRPDGGSIVIADRNHRNYMIENDGDVHQWVVIGTSEQGTDQDDSAYPVLLDGTYSNRTFVPLAQLGTTYFFSDFPFELDGTPVAMWGEDSSFFLEVVQVDQTVIVEGQFNGVEESWEVLRTFAYAPGEDETAVVRIGRIPRPYAVTSSLEGIVKLWNLEAGEALYEVDNGTGEPSVFGAINLPPSHLVWRDNANQNLYLLNFETGENKLIDDLEGQYAQWYFLSTDATVILAVSLGFEPVVVAWNVATGERTVLGEYRECNRPQPDMTRLSEDGTTLVIGCDTGLDIWRVAAE